jgi:hypothetical protein
MELGLGMATEELGEDLSLDKMMAMSSITICDFNGVRLHFDRSQLLSTSSSVITNQTPKTPWRN